MKNINNIQYLIASYCFAFTAVSSIVSSYYTYIKLIYKRILLLKLLLKLFLNLLLSDNSQQTLTSIRHSLSNF